MIAWACDIAKAFGMVRIRNYANRKSPFGYVSLGLILAY
jgi:hypothetical protein